MQPIIFVIGGPTASGKSLASQHLARNLKGIIINADSVQLYQELPLLTAKPTEEEMAYVPHRLYGKLTSQDTVTASLWTTWTWQEIEKTHLYKKIPLIVGGSGFYLKALMEGLSPMPEIPHEIRMRGQTIRQEQGLAILFDVLQRQDPESAKKLSPNDAHRILRAWEVWEATGIPLSVWQRQQSSDASKIQNYKFVKIFINPARSQLYQRINERVLKMMDRGALGEVKNLLELNITLPHPLQKAVGVHELSQYLKGCISYDEAIHQMQTKTRQYAKRQITWFSHQFKADLTYPFLYEEAAFERFAQDHNLQNF